MERNDTGNLEDRIRALEDRFAIYDLIATYGPSVDSRSADATAALWDEEGWYDFGGEPLMGAATVGTLVDSDTHVGYVSRGCAHVLGLPKVEIDGDRAIATNYSRVYLHQGDHWRVERAGVNRWELVRTEAGWKVAGRTNRLLDGSQDARSLLAAAVENIVPEAGNVRR